MKQGIAYLPGTFPTASFTKYVNQLTEDISEKQYTHDITDTIYFAYKDYILEGNTPFKVREDSWTDPYKGIAYIKDKTGFEVDYIFQWLYALDQAVYVEKTIDPQYILIIKAGSAPTPFRDIKEFFEKYQRMVIVGSVVALAGVGLYFGWPILTKVRRKLKK